MKHNLAPRRLAGGAACAAVLLLASCINVQSKITLAANGSGSIELEYTVSAFALTWETQEGKEQILPLPITEEDFRRAVSAVPGLSLRSWSASPEPQPPGADGLLVRAVLDFSSIEALGRFASRSGAAYRLTREGGRTIFEQTLAAGEAAVDAADFINAFFKNNVLSFSVTAPSNIRAAVPPGAKFSGREAAVSFPLPQLLQSREPLVFRVEW
ncbi:MAG: hypothetical protein LBC67_06470 [Spirochaetales bacterium]|jgi:hypothetical protein|nr:hypothetical protein [Spirochaetales bacterium]